MIYLALLDTVLPSLTIPTGAVYGVCHEWDGLPIKDNPESIIWSICMIKGIVTKDLAEEME